MGTQCLMVGSVWLQNHSLMLICSYVYVHVCFCDPLAGSGRASPWGVLRGYVGLWRAHVGYANAHCECMHFANVFGKRDSDQSPIRTWMCPRHSGVARLRWLVVDVARATSLHCALKFALLPCTLRPQYGLHDIGTPLPIQEQSGLAMSG